MQIIFMSILTILILAGCERPQKDPHLSDPVFLHYKKVEAELLKEKETLAGDLSKLNTRLTQLEAGSNERQPLLEEYFQKQRAAKKLTESLTYLQMKISERKIADGIAYMAAFEQKRPWPDPEEVKKFETMLRLEKKRGKEWIAEQRIHELLPKKAAPRAPAAEQGAHH
jgi:hypothetical protein